MTDVFSKRKRSEIMSGIKGHSNRSTELELEKIFRQHHIKGWKRHSKIFGKPDFVFRDKAVAVFVDGCFWHRCRLHFELPKTNKAFWKEKIGKNVKRDRLVSDYLARQGWRVLRIWQHELRNRASRKRLSNKLLTLLIKDSGS